MGSDRIDVMEERIRDRYKRIGFNISEYRRLRGYTQVQLAEKVGVTSNYLSQIECGRRKKYSLHVLMMVSEALEVPLSALCA